MREAELDAMREEVDKMQASINSEVMRAKTGVQDAVKTIEQPSAANTIALDKPAQSSGPLMPPMPAPPRMES